MPKHQTPNPTATQPSKSPVRPVSAKNIPKASQPVKSVKTVPGKQVIKQAANTPVPQMKPPTGEQPVTFLQKQYHDQSPKVIQADDKSTTPRIATSVAGDTPRQKTQTVTPQIQITFDQKPSIQVFKTDFKDQAMILNAPPPRLVESGIALLEIVKRDSPTYKQGLSIKQATNLLSTTKRLTKKASMMEACTDENQATNPLLSTLFESMAQSNMFGEGNMASPSIDLASVEQLKTNPFPQGAWIPGYIQSDDTTTKITFKPAALISESLGNQTQNVLDGIEELLKASLKQPTVQESMISNVCELKVKQAIEPEKNIRRILNGDPLFDVPPGYNKWKNWSIATFVPQTAVGGYGKDFKVSHKKDSSQTVSDIINQLEADGIVFEDKLFKPSITSLRGFGGDATWEQDYLNAVRFLSNLIGLELIISSEEATSVLWTKASVLLLSSKESLETAISQLQCALQQSIPKDSSA